MSTIAGTEIVERIWARDPTLWTGHDEAQWLGWLDEPGRMLESVDLLNQLIEEAEFDAGCLARHGRLEFGAGGHAARVRRRQLPRPRHDAPDCSAAPADSLDPARTLFVASSKSGGTLETRSHLDFFWER